MKIIQIVFRMVIAFIAFIIGVLAVFMIHSGLFDNSRRCPGIAINDSPKDNSLPILDSNEEYAVYSAILETLGAGETFIVSDNISDYFRIPTSYLTKNRDIYQLVDKFTVTGKVFLLSREEEDLLFPKGGAGWEKFYRKYPTAKGLVYFSKIDFSFEKNRAQVEVLYQCGNCRNGSKHWTLNKIKDKWIASTDDRYVNQ